MWITDSAPQPILEDGYNNVFGSGDLGPIPSLVVWTVDRRGDRPRRAAPHAFGRRVLATGGNEEAARFSGIDTQRIKFLVLVGSAVAAAVAGMLYAGRLQSGRFQWGEGDELSVIAAVILGGTSLFGGKASVIGALLGLADDRPDQQRADPHGARVQPAADRARRRSSSSRSRW